MASLVSSTESISVPGSIIAESSHLNAALGILINTIRVAPSLGTSSAAYGYKSLVEGGKSRRNKQYDINERWGSPGWQTQMGMRPKSGNSRASELIRPPFSPLWKVN